MAAGQSLIPITPMPHPTHRSGRWFLSLLGLAVALLGALFVWLMARSFLRAREIRSWPEVPCVILTSEVGERRHDPQSPPEFRLNLSYGYEWMGTPKTGDRLSLRGSSWTSKRDVIAQRAARFPPGAQTTCRVNPADPDFSLLQPDSLAPGYSIWFPALFVFGGLGISFRALTSNRASAGSRKSG
jgi:hypothetical protein